ncbi:MAG: hypothetical protein AAF725_07005 [Acidobacteriota bacterium]
MQRLRLIFLAAVLLAGAQASFGLSLFAISGADCDGDGDADIICSGGVYCGAVDLGALEGASGFCECRTADNTLVERKKCSDLPQLEPEPASFLEHSDFWQLLVPSERGTCMERSLERQQPLPEAAPAQDAA